MTSSRATDQPLHLGLTEAGMGMKGLIWSASAMGILLNEGIGDTIRVSLTPKPGGDRREEVYAACELLQALGIRCFSPSVTACPGCGRTTSSHLPGDWPSARRNTSGSGCRSGRRQYEGVETLTLAVMGCVVNGPGEIARRPTSASACPAPARRRTAPSTSTANTPRRCAAPTRNLSSGFRDLVDDYVATRYARRP